jgi:HlyD family secretion protein
MVDRSIIRRPGVIVSISATVIVILITSTLLIPRHSKTNAAIPTPAGSTPYVPVKRGAMTRTIRVGGTLAAVHFGGISAPALRGARFQLTLVRIADAGKLVKAGDVVAEFDRQQQRINYEDHEAQYNSLSDSILKRVAELKIEREKQLSDLQKAKADVDSARLENRRNEVVSKIDAEKNQQALAEAEATLKMQQETLDLKKASADAEIRLLEIGRDREKLAMEQARINYDRMVVKAPVDGMVAYQSFWKNNGNKMGTPQEGDTVWPGLVFMQIVDTTQMAMRARVNQLDAKYVRVGGPAIIHLDAYPGMSMPARVESLSPLGQNGAFGDKTRLFGIELSIQGTDPRLIPDISASADVEIESLPDSLLVPRGAVARLGSGDYVWMQTLSGVERRQVTLGLRDDVNWAVTSGVKEGEMIAAMAQQQ